MILTGSKIDSEVKVGNIKIEPYDSKMLSSNSYNYRLADVIYKIKDKCIDAKCAVEYEKIVIPKTGYCLEPGILYLASTLEKIGSDIYSMQLIGNPSISKLGLFLQITAPLGHVGSFHCWTLELKVVQPLIIYPGMKIGQISFWKVQGENNINYQGKYCKYTKPHISEFYKELNGGE